MHSAEACAACPNWLINREDSLINTRWGIFSQPLHTLKCIWTKAGEEPTWLQDATTRGEQQVSLSSTRSPVTFRQETNASGSLGQGKHAAETTTSAGCKWLSNVKDKRAKPSSSHKRSQFWSLLAFITMASYVFLFKEGSVQDWV